MRIIQNPEVRGILIIFLIILILGGVMAGTSGKLEQWFGITLFSGPTLEDKIVFVSGGDKSGDINVMDTDGSHRTALTDGARVLSAPAISPAGNRIAFVAMRGGQTQVFAVGANGGELEQLTSATGPKKEPSYTPDGRRLSFIASGKVYAADLNGDSPDPVLPTREEIRAAMSSSSDRREIPAYYSYAWAPDSASLAGVTRDEKDDDVLVYVPQHDHSAEAAHDEDACPQPQSWPVGKVIGFAWAAQKPVMVASVKLGQKSGLMVFDADQKRQGFVAVVDKQDFGAPALSPDGTEVVVPMKSLDKKAPSGLLKIELSSGQGGLIAEGVFENPVYSPKGDKILATIVNGKTDERDVATIDPSTGEVTQLTRDGKSFNAIWTPVSTK
ncbi:MAG: TolB family protein [Armatimonadota bacterium]